MSNKACFLGGVYKLVIRSYPVSKVKKRNRATPPHTTHVISAVDFHYSDTEHFISNETLKKYFPWGFQRNML
jgi:hypothetical protein